MRNIHRCGVNPLPTTPPPNPPGSNIVCDCRAEKTNSATEIFTSYKVLEIREPVGGDKFAPIVIIAEKSESKARRRVEVYRSNRELARVAKMLIAGDLIGVREWKHDGNRIIKEIITYFNEEEMGENNV